MSGCLWSTILLNDGSVTTSELAGLRLPLERITEGIQLHLKSEEVLPTFWWTQQSVSYCTSNDGLQVLAVIVNIMLPQSNGRVGWPVYCTVDLATKTVFNRFQNAHFPASDKIVRALLEIKQLLSGFAMRKLQGGGIFTQQTPGRPPAVQLDESQMLIWQCGLCSRRFSEPSIPAGCAHCAPRYHVTCLCGSKWYCTVCMSSSTKDIWTCIRCNTPSCGAGNPCFGERSCGECGEEDDICKDCTAKGYSKGLGDDVTAITYRCPLCKKGICNNCSRSSYNPCDECGMIFDACSNCMQMCASFGCETPVCSNCSRDTIRNPASRFCDDCVLKYARW